AEARELADQLGYERLVATRLRRHADGVDVVLDRLARDLLWRLEERPDVDVEAEVRERGGDHLRAAVVPVLPDLRDEDARAAALLGGERGDLAGERLPVGVVLIRGAVDAGDRLDLGLVAAPHLLERRRDLADRRPRARRLDRER